VFFVVLVVVLNTFNLSLILIHLIIRSHSCVVRFGIVVGAVREDRILVLGRTQSKLMFTLYLYLSNIMDKLHSNLVYHCNNLYLSNIMDKFHSNLVYHCNNINNLPNLTTQLWDLIIR
jgi:hypothetical protein